MQAVITPVDPAQRHIKHTMSYTAEFLLSVFSHVNVIYFWREKSINLSLSLKDK